MGILYQLGLCIVAFFVLVAFFYGVIFVVTGIAEIIDDVNKKGTK